MIFINFAIGFTSAWIGFFAGYGMWLATQKWHDR